MLVLSFAETMRRISELLKAGISFTARGTTTAVGQHEKLVQLLLTNEVVYYNLGNAYFKTTS
jgi:hypothetical protein